MSSCALSYTLLKAPRYLVHSQLARANGRMNAACKTVASVLFTDFLPALHAGQALRKAQTSAQGPNSNDAGAQQPK